MYNYHVDLVWKIDIILILVILLGTISVIGYSVFQWYLARLSRRQLLGIKEKIYAVLSGKKDVKVCPPEGFETTSKEFLDIVTNRKIWAAFFNASEQEYFKRCFVGQDAIIKLERVAARSLSKWRRIEAILALGYAGASSALGIFERGLFGRDRDISYFSMVALGQVKTELSARILLMYLRRNRISGQKIASIMEAFPPSTSSEVIKLTGDKDPLIRFWALKMLSRMKLPMDYLDGILSLVEDADPAVRAAACECLSTIKSAKSLRAILHLLKDDSWLVRASAVSSLADAGGSENLKYIADMLKDSSLNVIDAAKDALIKNIDSAMPYLEKIIKGDDVLARKSAIEVLSLTGRYNEGR